MEEDKKAPAPKKKEMAVSRGKAIKVNEARDKEREEKEELRMRAFMIPRKHRKIYGKLKRKERKQNERKAFLKEKREALEQPNKKLKKDNKD